MSLYSSDHKKVIPFDAGDLTAWLQKTSNEQPYVLTTSAEREIVRDGKQRLSPRQFILTMNCRKLRRQQTAR
jgi:hypothetical protein